MDGRWAELRLTHLADSLNAENFATCSQSRLCGVCGGVECVRVCGVCDSQLR